MSATGLQPLNTTTIVVFGLFLITTLLITLWGDAEDAYKRGFFCCGTLSNRQSERLSASWRFSGCGDPTRRRWVSLTARI